MMGKYHNQLEEKVDRHHKEVKDQIQRQRRLYLELIIYQERKLNCKRWWSNKFPGILRVIWLENIFTIFNKVPSYSAFGIKLIDTKNVQENL